METLIVHVTDAGGMECAVEIAARAEDLGEAIGQALTQLFRQQPAVWKWPLFVDVQPAHDFADRSWMYAPIALVAQTPAIALEA